VNRGTHRVLIRKAKGRDDLGDIHAKDKICLRMGTGFKRHRTRCNDGLFQNGNEPLGLTEAGTFCYNFSGKSLDHTF
jgi:hypothetical protein